MIAIVESCQVAYDEHRFAGFGLPLPHHELNRPPYNQLGDLFLGDLVRQHLRHGLAVPHHDDPVGDLKRLFQLVANEDDALAILFENLDDLKKLLHFLWRQHRSWFIEHQIARLTTEHLDDLNPLLDTNRKVLYKRLRIDFEVITLGDLPDVMGRSLHVEPASGTRRLHTKNHILRDGEDRDQHEVLVHHADASRNSVIRRRQLEGFPVDEHFSGIRRIQPIQNIHQGRFAGPVLTQQGQYLAGLNRETDIVIGEHAGKLLRYSSQLQSHNSASPCGAMVTD